MKIQYYKTNHGLFFTLENYYSSINSFIVNGVELNTLPKYGSYYKVQGESIEVKQKVSPTKVQNGWTLKNKEIESKVLHLNLELQDIKREWNDDSDCYEYSGEFGSYASLYEPVFEELPAKLVSVDVELVLLGELQIDNLTKPEETKVSVVSKNGWNELKTQISLASIVNYDDLIRIVVPDFMLHNHPCSLSSEQVYKIVRAYLQENIDRKVAKITSDYDFCFTVEKIITKHKPVSKSVELKKSNGHSYSTPRFTKIETTSVYAKIFEMTYSGYIGRQEGYNGYTPIAPWKADNLADMQMQVKFYLDKLLEVINEPMKECNCCKGTGFLFEGLKTNDRI